MKLLTEWNALPLYPRRGLRYIWFKSYRGYGVVINQRRRVHGGMQKKELSKKQAKKQSEKSKKQIKGQPRRS